MDPRDDIEWLRKSSEDIAIALYGSREGAVLNAPRVMSRLIDDTEFLWNAILSLADSLGIEIDGESQRPEQLVEQIITDILNEKSLSKV